MVKSSLCDYSHAYILVIGTITINEAAADNVAKRLELKNNFAPFTDRISKKKKTILKQITQKIQML